MLPQPLPMLTLGRASGGPGSPRSRRVAGPLRKIPLRELFDFENDYWTDVKQRHNVRRLSDKLAIYDLLEGEEEQGRDIDVEHILDEGLDALLT